MPARAAYAAGMVQLIVSIRMPVSALWAFGAVSYTHLDVYKRQRSHAVRAVKGGEAYMRPLKIALLQIAPCGGLEGNLEKGIRACREAKEMGADIALFPEDVYKRQPMSTLSIATVAWPCALMKVLRPRASCTKIVPCLLYTSRCV